jgi:hypothetical protein
MIDAAAHPPQAAAPTAIYASIPTTPLKEKISVLLVDTTILALREFLYFGLASVFFSQGFYAIPIGLIAFGIMDAVSHLHLLSFWAERA